MQSEQTVPSTSTPSELPEQINTLSAEFREKYVAEAAFYKSEKRGFEPGFEEQDWLDAENEIEALLLQYGLVGE